MREWLGRAGTGPAVASIYGQEAFAYDRAGNMTYDGQHKYKYDAWNRPVEVERAFKDSGGTLTAASVVATLTYDGLGRRIVKKTEHSGDWNAQYHFYYNGSRMIEGVCWAYLPNIRLELWLGVGQVCPTYGLNLDIPIAIGSIFEQLLWHHAKIRRMQRKELRR